MKSSLLTTAYRILHNTLDKKKGGPLRERSGIRVDLGPVVDDYGIVVGGDCSTVAGGADDIPV